MLGWNPTTPSLPAADAFRGAACLASHFPPPLASGVSKGRDLTRCSVSSLLEAHIFRREECGCLSVDPSHLQSVHQSLGVALIQLCCDGEKVRSRGKTVATQPWKTGSAITKQFQKAVKWEALTRHGRGSAGICLCRSKSMLRCHRGCRNAQVFTLGGRKSFCTEHGMLWMAGLQMHPCHGYNSMNKLKLSCLWWDLGQCGIPWPGRPEADGARNALEPPFWHGQVRTDLPSAGR